MADYIVTSGELTTVANAIRAKNGTSSNLSWPDGFVSGISSGGGGESDFSTAEVTIATTRRLGAQYSLNCQAETGNSFVSAIINPIGSLNTSADDEVVTVNNPVIHNILFTKNGHIDIFTPTYDNITVEGNGEVITDGEEKFARAYGDCTITINETTGK